MNKESIVNNILFPTIKNLESSYGISDVINKDPFVKSFSASISSGGVVLDERQLIILPTRLTE